MSLVSQILTVFKADTSEMKAKLKELTGIEKERAAEQLKNTEKENSNYDSVISKMGKMNQAIELVGKATDFAAQSMRAYGEHMRLTAATAGVNVSKLTEAFGGLVSQHDILTMAAQTQTGVLRLNQEEMETLGKAAVAMKNRGFDLAESFKKITDAAVKGKVEGLDDLGLSIKAGESKAQTLRNMMGELNKVIAESGSATSNAADDVTRMGVAWENTTDSLKRFSAEAIMALAEPLKMIQDIKDEIERGKAQLNGKAVSQESVFGAFQGAAARRYSQPTKEQLDAKMRAESENIEMPDDDRSGDLKAMQDKRAAAAKTMREERKRLTNEVAKSLTDDLITQLELEAQSEASASGLANVSSMLMQQMAKGPGYDTGAIDDAIARTGATADAANAKAYEAFNQGAANSKMEKVFGPIEDIHVYDQAFLKLGDTFTAFGEAVGSSYEAIVTGQGGASAAFRKVMADSLMAIGKSSVVSALRETALGFGALAFGSPTAAMHFKSAGLHAAVAVAAGAAANQLGTSAQGAASEKASAEKAKAEEKAEKDREKNGKGGVDGGKGGSGSDRPITIIMGDSFSEDSPRMRAIRSRDAVDRAIRERDD